MENLLFRMQIMTLECPEGAKFVYLFQFACNLYYLFVIFFVDQEKRSF